MAKPLRKITALKEGFDDKGMAHELRLYADNTSHLYNSSKVPIMKNLEKKKAKGVYNHDKAIKLWGYHADRAAHAYHKELGDKSIPWHKAWPTHIRKMAAKAWADDFHENGE